LNRDCGAERSPRPTGVRVIVARVGRVAPSTAAFWHARSDRLCYGKHTKQLKATIMSLTMGIRAYAYRSGDEIY